MPKSRTPAWAEALSQPAADKRVEILRRVAEGGSISQAARDAGVSYKAAWQALDTLSNLAGTPLVERAVGGAGGGGARLTPAGESVLRAAGALAQARTQVLTRLAKPGRALPVPGLALRTSMRNQLPAEVQRLRAQGGAVAVELHIAGGMPLVSLITKESAQLLGLRAGLPVLALCKATAVSLEGDAAQPGATNRLAGRLARVSRARGGGEFALALASGATLVGFSAAGASRRIGDEAAAIVAPSAVVIALP